MGYTLRMLIGCILPFLLIFVLPLFGVDEGVTLSVLIVLMFACHLFMMRGPSHREQDENQSTPTRKGSDDAHS